MITEDLDLVCGRTVKLVRPDPYKLACSDIDIPNYALRDLSDILVYGGIITGAEDREKRTEENWQLIRSQYELAALCCNDPPLILRGAVPEGALTPDDLYPPDLTAIYNFFRFGGKRSVPPATDNGHHESTHGDSAGETVGQTAE